MSSRLSPFTGIALVTIGAILTVPSHAPVVQAQATVQAQPEIPAAPEVLQDGRITFRVSAPTATAVSLILDDGPVRTLPLAKDGSGMWSVTTGPLPPETYMYDLTVDGKEVFGRNPIVEVPANPPRFDQEQKVPRGGITEHTYHSNVQDADRKLNVYVPAEYAGIPAARYPVLYLYHGGTGTEADWPHYGRAGVILDNLIAGKRAVPMIVVMVNGNLLKPVPAPAGGVPAAPNPQLDDRMAQQLAAFSRSTAALGRELVTDIVPFIERSFRVQANREKRAVAGLSAGGGTAFIVGMTNLDMFATIGEFGAGLFGGSAPIEKIPAAMSPELYVPAMLKNSGALAGQLKLLYMSCGTQDPRLRYQRETLETLKSSKYSPVFIEFAGDHQWKVFRHSLHNLAQRLFR